MITFIAYFLIFDKKNSVSERVCKLYIWPLEAINYITTFALIDQHMSWNAQQDMQVYLAA